MILAVIFTIVYGLSPLFLIPWLITTKSDNKKLENELKSARENSEELAKNLRELREKMQAQKTEPEEAMEPIAQTVAEQEEPQAQPMAVYEEQTVQPIAEQEIPVAQIVEEPQAQTAPELMSTLFIKPATIKTEEEKKVSTISVMLTLGAILISIAGIVFATTTWGNLGNIARAITVLSFSFIFFIVSLIAEKGLKIPKTGTVFYVLGSVFLPITVIAAGYFELFGYWFSLSGEGKMLLWATVFLSYAVAAFRGTKSYNSKVFAWTALASTSAMVCCITDFFTKEYGIFTLCLAGYALIVVLVMRYYEENGDKEQSIFLSIFKSFSICNLAVLSVMAFVAPFVDDRAVFVIFGAVLFAAAWFVAQPAFKSGGLFALPFILFVTIALCKPVAEYGTEQILLMITLSMSVNMCLSFIKVIPESFRKILMIAGMGCEALLIFFLVLLSFATPGVTALAAFIVLSSTCTALWFFNQDNAYGKIFQIYIPLALIGLSVTFAQNITELFEGDIIAKSEIFVVAMLVFQTLFVLVRKPRIRTITSDFLFAGSAIVASMVIRHSDEYIDAYSVASALIRVAILFAAITSFLILVEKEENYYPVKKVIATLMGAITLTQLPFVFIEYEPDECGLPMLIYAALIAVVSLGLSIFAKNKERKHAVDTLTYFSLFVTLVFAIAEVILNEDLYFLCFEILLLMFFVVVKLVQKRENTKGMLLPERLSRYSFYGLNLIFSTVLIFTGNISTMQFVTAMVATVIVIVISAGTKNNAYAIASVVELMLLAVHYPITLDAPITVNYLIIALMFVLSLGLSIGLYRNELVKKTEKSVSVDIFTITRPILVLLLFACADSDVVRWLSILFGGIVTLTFIKVGYDKNKIRIILSLAAMFLVPSWIFQPFFQFPDIIETEMILLPIILYFVAIKLMWKNTETEKLLEHCLFAVSLISFLILIMSALVSSETIDALIIAVSATLLVIYSFIVKHKRWFILGIVVVLGIVLKMTWGFWTSLDWWVYLLSAGIIFLAIGITNEVRKKRAEAGETEPEKQKKTRFMSDWSW